MRTVTAASAVGALIALAAPSAFAQDAIGTSSRSVALPDIGDHQVLIESLQSRLDRLAGRLDAVGDQVSLLSDTALGGDITETRAVITHRNELGSSFALERALYTLDGGVLLDRVDENGSLSDVEELVLFDGRLEPGEHLLEVEVVCKGSAFGVFSYVESYRFRVTSRYVLKVSDGRTNNLRIAVTRLRDITLEPAKRLTVRYDFDLESGPDADASTAP